MPVQIDGFKGGDRTSIELPKVQRDFLKALKDAGKQVIFVNCSGSAIALAPETETCDAIVQAWYAGQEGGTAIAEVLFGEQNPSGKLPVTFYKNDSQLPDYEDYSGSKWVKGDDDFYYYTDIVEVGDYTEEPIFDTYTVGVAPAVAVAGAVKQIYFQLEISTQAISAKQLDGSNWPTYTAAWDNAFSQN